MLSKGKELSNILRVPLYKAFDLTTLIDYSVTGTICLTNKGVWLMYGNRYMSDVDLFRYLQDLQNNKLMVRYPLPKEYKISYEKVPKE